MIQSQSPRKRILTQLGSFEPSRISENNSILRINKFKKLNEVFRFSPNHSHQLSVPDMSYRNSSRSKIRVEPDPLKQLNAIFRQRKISSKKAFFGQNVRPQNQRARSKSKINQDIQHSIIYLQNLKNKKELFSDPPAQNNYRHYNSSQNKKQTIIGMIGLQLPAIQPKNEIRNRFLTQPTFNQTRFADKKKKQLEKIGLYSYLERDNVCKKQLNITQNKIIDYSKNPNNKNFHRIILQKSRNFLKHQAENNFKQLYQIDNVITNQSKKIIQQQIKTQKQKYGKEYLVRNSVPYFSFLTLNQKEKQSVIRSLHRKRSVS